jgi:DNA polymerase elongation subunit (family B)
MGQPATLVVDIETVGQEMETIPARAREILLDVETDEERTKVLDCLGLDPCTGRIICIGVYWIELDKSRAYCHDDERELLANFWNDMGQIRPQKYVTFNGKSFDFPYINIRSAINGVPVPRDVVLDTRRFSTERHFDVREVMTNYERYRKGTLEFFCEIFGVPSPKNGINGKNVGEYFKAGKLDEIAKYCLGDCKATGQLYLKLRNYYR